MNLRRFVIDALEEDLGPGDVTTDSCVTVHAHGHGFVLAKQDLVLAGHEVAGIVFDELGCTYEVLVADGVKVTSGTRVARVEGPLRSFLKGERLALNLLMKLSGIATNVRTYVDAAQGKLRVVDTRKTTPLVRDLEKYAVRCGGGHNHRRGLYDGAMVKDNHIAAVGGLTEAVRRTRDNLHHLVRIEVEVGDLDTLREALATDADVILLDNMSDAMLQESVAIARATRPVLLEASGNITPERIARIRDFGLDVVSAGGLIHQARWVDLSLKIAS